MFFSNSYLCQLYLSDISFKKVLKFLIFISFFIYYHLVFSTFAQAEMLSVKGDKVNLREKPNRDSSIQWEYGAGFPLEVIRRQDNWVKVKDYENDEGWIHKSLLSDKKYVIVNTNQNTKNTVNIRTGPGLSYPINGRAHYGVVFELIEMSNGWIKILHESGLTGWIKNTLVWGD